MCTEFCENCLTGLKMWDTSRSLKVLGKWPNDLIAAFDGDPGGAHDSMVVADDEDDFAPETRIIETSPEP